MSQQPAPANVLIVAPFLHRPGHTASYPRDLAAGMALAGARVTLACPVTPNTLAYVGGPSASIDTVIFEREVQRRPRIVRWLWSRVAQRPFLQSLIGLTFGYTARHSDLVFFTDTEPGLKSGLWCLQAMRLLGYTGKRTAFVEHFPYAWSANRFSRWTRSDRLRLRGIEMLSFSRRLLDMNRSCMNWKDVGQYVPWGVWPRAQSDDDRRQARLKLDLDPRARVLLVFGVLSIRRKQVDALAAALQTLDLGVPIEVVFAGPRACELPHPFDNAELRSKPLLNIRRDERFVPDEEVEAYFAAADAVWANYGGFAGASGVLLQSMGFGRLPIASDAGEIGELCRRHDCGLLVEVNDANSLRACLQAFIQMSPSAQSRQEQAAAAAADQLSWRNIGHEILRGLATVPSIVG